MSQIIHISCKNNQTILDACREQKVMTEGVCGGQGLCGKCKIRVVRGEVPVTEKDRSFFTAQELDSGFRLACMAYPQTPCEVEVFFSLDEMRIVTEQGKFNENTHKNNAKQKNNDIINIDKTSNDKANINKTNMIAVDIGTTTVAMQLLELTLSEDKTKPHEVKVKDTYAVINEQRNYGADVLSRIKASVDGNGQQLRECIQRILAEGMRKLTGGFCDTIVIGGNTTMIHLLMGYSCKTLGVAPFTPVTTQMIKSHAEQFFLDHIYKTLPCELKKTKVLILSGISAFVGGDIVAGLYETGISASDKIQMFVDLGTNAEMAIGSRRKLFVTSAAAGPAFEGGGISCGCASIKGAICEANLSQNGTWKLKTIGEESPVGICGTGVIEIISELIRAGRLDHTGLLDEGETDKIVLSQKENIYLTQKDIRTFQMAKAAICAGMQTLLKEYGTDFSKIEKVYIAGGFGYYLNIQKAAVTGLFPKELHNKIIPVGNTVLSGIRSFVQKEGAGYELEKIRKMAKEINLANHEYFKESYLENMYFD